MKRFVWLILAAFCTALAQVQPVDLPVAKAEVCSCCEQPGACGMPDCALPPATPAPAATLRAPTVVQLAERCTAPQPVGQREKFYVQFLPRPALMPASAAPLRAVPAASVPLFREHCSFLL